jgi:HD superfamily phosphohydrolase
MSEPEDGFEKLLIQTAGLVHDVGHGPFSHTMEEILKENGIDFHHETMTKRFITDQDSAINGILCEVDKTIPGRLLPFLIRNFARRRIGAID